MKYKLIALFNAEKKMRINFIVLKLIAVLLFGIGPLGLHAQTMYVKDKSSAQTIYLLNNINKMSFSLDTITVIKTDGNSDTYSLSELRYLSFNDLDVGILFAEKPKIAMQLFPNPGVDVLNIILSTTSSQSYVIEILSIDGKKIYKEKINGQNKVYQINISILSRGIYLCRIHNGITTETSKFIKL